MVMCAKCQTEDPTAFYPSQVKPRGDGKAPKGGFCKKCHRAYYKAKVEGDSDYFVKYQREYRRNALKEIEELKASIGCSMCGEKHPACLDFHHIDASTKISTVSQMLGRENKRMTKAMAEIAKCILLCSNCHRKLHYEEKTGNFRKKSPHR